MKKWIKNEALKWTFSVLAISCFTATICLILALIMGFTMWLILPTVICFIAFICFYRLAILKASGYQLKYYFSNKKYKQEIEKSLVKFKGASQIFIDEFKRETNRRYKYAGYIFSRDANDTIYKDKKARETILSIYEKLYNSILSKKGFIEFFNEVDKLNLESSWIIHSYMINDLISNELEYLITSVYNLTDFTVYDNGLSSEFTERNNKMIEDLNNIYSPILFGFKEEIEEVLKKLKG